MSIKWPAKNTPNFSFKYLYFPKGHSEMFLVLSNFDKWNSKPIEMLEVGAVEVAKEEGSNLLSSK